MKTLKLLFILFISYTPIYGQKIIDKTTVYKKDCDNCNYILSEAGKAYRMNFEIALKENTEIHNYVNKLIDLNKIHQLRLKAEKAYKFNNKEEYYRYFEKLKTISNKYISDFAIKTKGDAHIFIDLGHVENGLLKNNVYVDSGVKYGKLRVYYNLETGELAHIKADDYSYKSFMNDKTKKANKINIWVFKDYKTLAYTMNNETKADKDISNICENFIEYTIDESTNNFTLVNANRVITKLISLSLVNCN